MNKVTCLSLIWAGFAASSQPPSGGSAGLPTCLPRRGVGGGARAAPGPLVWGLPCGPRFRRAAPGEPACAPSAVPVAVRRPSPAAARRCGPLPLPLTAGSGGVGRVSAVNRGSAVFQPLTFPADFVYLSVRRQVLWTGNWQARVLRCFKRRLWGRGGRAAVGAPAPRRGCAGRARRTAVQRRPAAPPAAPRRPAVLPRLWASFVPFLPLVGGGGRGTSSSAARCLGCMYSW